MKSSGSFNELVQEDFSSSINNDSWSTNDNSACSVIQVEQKVAEQEERATLPLTVISNAKAVAQEWGGAFQVIIGTMCKVRPSPVGAVFL